MKIGVFLLMFIFMAMSCQNKNNNSKVFHKVVNLDKDLVEVSGIVATDTLVWAIEDSGNKTNIYGINYQGKTQKTIQLKGISNRDWEDLTHDKNNNLYIGDFGNNDNSRRDLVIYKVSTKKGVDTIEKINFFYPEQKEFPAKKREKLYDCEAFFLFQNNFYLFTKNRSKGFDGTTLLYKIPAVAGNHTAHLMGKFKTCSNNNSCAITGAAISPDEKKVVILSHDKIWLFEDFKEDDFLNGKIVELTLDHYSQKEAISFKDDQTLYIADERHKKTGGNLYEVSLAKLKSSH